MKPLFSECVPPATSTSLQRFLDVVTDPDSALQLDRQLILLDSFLAATGDSAKLTDLRLLARVVSFLESKSQPEAMRAFRAPLQRILDLLKCPPRMERSSQQLTHGDYLIELFTALGRILLRTENRDIKRQVLEIIVKIILTKRSAQSSCVPARTCVHAAEVSDLAECLSDLVSVVEEERYLWTIHVVHRLCSVSALCCWTLLSRNVIDSLLVRLTTARNEERSAVIDSTRQLLWRLFTCTDHAEDWSQVPLPSRTALRSLRYVLREEGLVHNRPGRYSNDFQNVGSIVLKLLHLFPNADHVLSGLTEDITFYATMTEAVIAIDILPYFKSQQDHVHFKKLMLACLALSPVSSASLAIFTFYRVPECLVAMLNGRSVVSSSASSVHWPPQLGLDLFECALHCVSTMFDCLQHDFIKAGLLRVLVTFLDVHYVLENNSLNSVGYTVIKTIMSICFRKVEARATRDAFLQAGAVEVLLRVCEVTLSAEAALTIRHQSVLSRSLCVLAALLADHRVTQSECSDRSLRLVSALYRRINQPLPSDSLVDNRLVVAVSNFTWESIVWNNENVFEFIRSGEIFTHLDILEGSPYSVQMVFLSVLVDLCEFPQSIPYVVSWRGREGAKLLSVLCRIWRAEESRLGVPRSEQNGISDIDRPLMGEEQHELTVRAGDKIVSTCDVLGSVRPKIYAILQLLHRHKDVVDLCEAHYRLGWDEVTHEDRVTLQLVEAYLPLKLGEIWREIRHKQVPERVQPLDKYLAHTLAERHRDWALRVQRAQEECVGVEDVQYYSLVRAGRLTSALAALREVVAIAQSADREVMFRSHRRLRECIDASRVAYPPDVNVTLVNSTTDIVSFSNV